MIVFTEWSPAKITVAPLACIVVFAWRRKILTKNIQFKIYVDGSSDF